MVDNSDRIDKFLRKQMTPEENKLFLDDLKNNAELRKEAQMTALMIQELQERQAKEDAEIIEDVLLSKRKAKARFIKIRVKWALSLAAMFVLLFGAYIFLNQQPNTNALFDKYYTEVDVTSQRGGDDEALKQELAELYNKVGTEKDVTSTITRLQTIYDGILSNSDGYYDYSYYENDIAWYLALAYIKDHNLDKAKELINLLAEYGNEEAQKLLIEIEALQ